MLNIHHVKKSIIIEDSTKSGLEDKILVEKKKINSDKSKNNLIGTDYFYIGSKLIEISGSSLDEVETRYNQQTSIKPTYFKATIYYSETIKNLEKDLERLKKIGKKYIHDINFLNKKRRRMGDCHIIYFKNPNSKN